MRLLAVHVQEWQEECPELAALYDGVLIDTKKRLPSLNLLAGTILVLISRCTPKAVCLD